MGSIRSTPTDALLFFGIFSGRSDVLDRTKRELARRFGSLITPGPRIDFTDTDYYQRSMGPNLLKEWFAVDQISDQAELASIKVECQSLEKLLDRMASPTLPGRSTSTLE